MLDGLLAPNLAPEVTLVLENPPNWGLRPALASGSWDTFRVQTLDDGGQPNPFGGPFENRLNDLRFVWVNLNPRSERHELTVGVLLPRGVRHENFAKPILARAGREAPVHLTGEAALDLLRELFQIERVDEAMDRDERIGLFGGRVNPLGDVDDADAEELQLLHHPNGVGNVAGDARAVVDEHHIERFRLACRSGEQTLDAWAILDTGARNPSVGVDVVLQNGPIAL